MDLFVDLKVPAVDGSQWTAAERQREEKSLCGNDLQTLLDFCGSPQNDAVERRWEAKSRRKPLICKAPPGTECRGVPPFVPPFCFFTPLQRAGRAAGRGVAVKRRSEGPSCPRNLLTTLLATGAQHSHRPREGWHCSEKRQHGMRALSRPCFETGPCDHRPSTGSA